jgi:hypothetical protein
MDYFAGYQPTRRSWHRLSNTMSEATMAKAIGDEVRRKRGQSGPAAALLLCTLAAAPSVAPAAQPPSGLLVGMRLQPARRILLKRGWRPVDVHRGKPWEPIGAETALVKASIREVESCAMDRAVCLLHYARRGACLRVVVEGEDVHRMRVSSWGSDCPRLDRE